MTTDNADAEDSICPKGWKMPSYSGDENNPGADSWGNLLGIIYGIPSTYSYDAYRETNWAKRWPLNFMPTGQYYNTNSINTGYIIGHRRVTDSHWWSMTSNSDKNSYNLGISYTFDDGGYTRYNSLYGRGSGIAIRCVVRS